MFVSNIVLGMVALTMAVILIREYDRTYVLPELKKSSKQKKAKKRK